jgi:hypothetical protein
MLSSPVISPRGRRGGGKSDTLVAVLFTLLGAAVIAIAVLASVLQKRNETIEALKEKVAGMGATHRLAYFANHGGNLPLATAVKKSPSGYVLILTNESSEGFSLGLRLTNAAGQTKATEITLEGRQTGEFSHFDEWKLTVGDSIEISHEGFNSVVMRVH